MKNLQDDFFSLT